MKWNAYFTKREGAGNGKWHDIVFLPRLICATKLDYGYQSMPLKVDEREKTEILSFCADWLIVSVSGQMNNNKRCCWKLDVLTHARPILEFFSVLFVFENRSKNNWGRSFNLAAL